MSYPPQGYYPRPPEHPESTTVLILGILGLAMCGLCAPFAWVKGRKVVAEIDASGGQIGGRSQANAGYIMGIVGSCVLGVSILVVAGSVLLLVMTADSSTY
ncbi:DUF4190 domain-containing protein [Nocardia salmonicida]|uniref:hypothetical protein n=1 Tax=Nocardia salmonicida TaxID=53431 RepID=UPI0007A37CD4|nr:hypothetical protein [Nocardia salmonicida]